MNMYVLLFRSVERVYELIRKTCWDEGPMPYEHWLDTPDHFYVIANTFNFCVVLIARLGSTTVLPLYSNMDCTTGTLCIGFISDQQHFIQLQMRDGSLSHPMHVQWQYHRDVGVSGWAYHYYERIAELSNLTEPGLASGDQLVREIHEKYSTDFVSEGDYKGGTTACNHPYRHWEE
ncbi:hypothetical protein M9H77_13753 [Catharanthus roseus]|uniref:Uncharacterized protein n=1 Tax=Catharanthus roseus TaxID=4058 RepID=A0ACC0BLD5_CATRO|nr:hypothetical protein M9H77_13753 [Catharanthus roseus]